MLKTTLADLHTHVGATIGPSEWIKVGQQRIDGYADAVSDHNWIHCDVPRATAAFGGTIAHGLLTLSMAPPIAQTLIDIDDVETDLNYGFDKVRFLSVVHGGDRIRLWLKVLEVVPRGAGVILRMEYSIEVEGKAKPAIVADWLFILFPRAEKLAAQAKLESKPD
ncbi:MaoC family dehydratase [Sphingomonas colocasiae]|uniref:MaoC family dehydratase n=1 Tax=Sphingomonas colocasiae TaxID=1848973 RepID=A0ABS7PWF3_9SPHN|nr:MaoC family dehydratase [Sphingomonas colocasiae]MBY8824309.1 MaoC family dehydratase [Sphingomonas colocasiae]